MERRHVRDLPGPVVRSIVNRARSRLIPGTNRFASVCSSWRDCTSSGSDDEKLQLLLSVHQVQGDDLKACLAWLQQHGGCVTSLSVTGSESGCWPVVSRLLVAPQTFGPHLTRLEVQGRDTLLPLAPHLQQLPSLQHLRASIDIRYLTGKKGSSSRKSRSCVRATDVPDLRELFPQLVSLHLTVDSDWDSLESQNADLDGRLLRLLPVGLQRLHLASGWEPVKADCALLSKLTALSHLTFHAVTVEHPEQLEGMSRLQQLELWTSSSSDVDLVPLASKLAALWHCSDAIPVTTLCQVTGLTALAFCAAQYNQYVEEPEDNPLLSLTSLRHLHIDSVQSKSMPNFCGDGNTWLFSGLGSLSSLRSLSIAGDYWPDMLKHVAGATQLTCLYMGFWYRDPYAWGTHKVLRQLRQLQRLEISSMSLREARTALTALKQLTHLVVRQGLQDHPTGLEGVCAAVAGRVPKLKQLVYLQNTHSGGDPPDLYGMYGEGVAQVVPSPLPGVVVQHGCSRMRCPLYPVQVAMQQPRRIGPCPHLPGVWELDPPA